MKGKERKKDYENDSEIIIKMISQIIIMCIVYSSILYVFSLFSLFSASILSFLGEVR